MDNCCLNRPSDDQSNPRIHLESEAIKTIIDLVENDTWELLSSVSYLVYPKLKDTVPFNLSPLIYAFQISIIKLINYKNHTCRFIFLVYRTQSKTRAVLAPLTQPYQVIQ